ALPREVFASLALRVSIFAVVSLPVTTVSQKCATSKLTLRVAKTLGFRQNWRCRIRAFHLVPDCIAPVASDRVDLMGSDPFIPAAEAKLPVFFTIDHRQQRV
ncbi:MAG TPA: hypothetical protein PK992_17260, partial [Planctomycetaceae bacterium]|nr:hypothetical protein [Planctomycetaceae bacterium]